MNFPPLAVPAIIFFCNAVIYISLFSRLPSLVEMIGIDKGHIGMALLGASVGTVFALPTATRLVFRFTPRVLTAILLPAVAAIPILIFAIPSFWVLMVAFFVFGYLRTLLDVSQNIIATQIEAETGKGVMSRSHGFWSVGLLAGSLLSGLLTSMAMSGLMHMSVVAIMVVAFVAVLLVIAPKTAPVAVPAGKPLFVMPDRLIFVVCAMVFGIGITEGAIYDWAAFYIRQVLEADASAVGILFSFFTVGMAAMRMSGDSLRARFSSPSLVRWSATCAFAGVVLLLWSPNLVVTALALTLIGCGVALNAPLAVSTAARIGAGNPTDNIAALSMVNTFAFLGVPAALGFVAEQYGLKTAFMLLLPALVISFCLAPITGYQRRSTAQAEAVPAE